MRTAYIIIAIIIIVLILFVVIKNKKNEQKSTQDIEQNKQTECPFPPCNNDTQTSEQSNEKMSKGEIIADILTGGLFTVIKDRKKY